MITERGDAGLFRYLFRLVSLLFVLCWSGSLGSEPLTGIKNQQEDVLPLLYTKEDFALQVEGIDVQALLTFIAEEFGWQLQLNISEEMKQQRVDLSVVNDHLEQVLAAIPQPTPDAWMFQLRPPDLLVTSTSDERGDGEVMLEAASQPRPLLTRYYRVHYADAHSLQALIQQSAGGEGWLSERGRAQLDERSNTLVVTDTSERLASIDVLLSELDVPVSQVLVEARIVSASLDSARQLGVHWQALESSEQAGTVVTAGSNPPVAGAGGQQANDWRLGLGEGLQFQGGFANDRFRLELDLAAMQAAGKVELLARPSIMTRANQQASIQSGVRVPYQSQAGGTAGGSVTQFVDAVLALTVLPRITPDGQVHMELEVRQDAVAADSASVPAINTNTISTQVRLENHDTLVLGGIFSDQRRANESGVPVLGRLPVVGRLFRQSRHAVQRNELLIFITPVIIPAH